MSGAREKVLAERIEDARGTGCPHCTHRPIEYGRGVWTCGNCGSRGVAVLAAPGRSVQQYPLAGEPS